MTDVSERRRQALEKIESERAALQSAFLTLQPPLKRLEKGISAVASVRHYWKPISLSFGALSFLLMIRRIFFLKKRKPVLVVQSSKEPKPKPTPANVLVLWVSRAWRAYRWYVKVRGWFV